MVNEQYNVVQKSHLNRTIAQPNVIHLKIHRFVHAIKIRQEIETNMVLHLLTWIIT